MTIILAAQDQRNPIHLLSDLVLSSPSKYSQKVWLPHRQLPHKHEFGDTSISFLAQKTIIFGRTTFQWAGRQTIAKAVFSQFYEATRGGELFAPLSESVSSLNLLDVESSSVSYLTYYCKPDGGLISNGHKMKSYSPKSDNTLRVIAAGSGCWDFLENYHVNVRSDIRYPLYIDVLHRLAARFVEPWFFEEKTLHMKYGSWFELSRHVGSTFVKIPLAFKFWIKERKGGCFSEHGPLVFSQYLGHDLVICAAYHNQRTREARLTTAFVSDPLQRSGLNLRTHHAYVLDNLNFQPSIFIHIKADVSSGTGVDLRIAPYFVDADPLVKLIRTQMELTAPWIVEYDPGLLAMINQDDGADEVVIYNPWD